MKNINTLVIRIALATLACCLTDGCALFRQSADKQSGEKQAVVSSVPLPSASPYERVQEQPPVELYYGEGDCAPKFANGMRGTCINNKPCNGFGVKDEKGNLECECFGVKGGCGEGMVCSVIKRACVPLFDAER